MTNLIFEEPRSESMSNPNIIPRSTAFAIEQIGTGAIDGYYFVDEPSELERIRDSWQSRYPEHDHRIVRIDMSDDIDYRIPDRFHLPTLYSEKTIRGWSSESAE